MSEVIHADMNYVGGEQTTAVEVGIRDGRAEPPGSWQDCGFELRAHKSAVANWDDPQEIARVHYPEIMELALAVTGCDHALVGGHIRRNPEQASKVHEDLGPITFVHSDFAPSYRDVILDRYRNPSAEAQASLDRAGISVDTLERATRMVIIQFWRNTGPAKMDMPIAFCDARTVGSDELAVIDVKDYAGGGIDFQALGIRMPADPSKHAWYTFPNMHEDEVVVFRTFDTDMVEPGLPFWTPHSAFRDPDVESGNPSRRSIELRATCLFI